MLLFASACWSQQQPPLTPDEEKAVLKLLIDRDEFLNRSKELENQLRILDEQIRLDAERLRLERDQRLSEKKLHLSALKALAEYRIKRRSLFSKVVTFGIRGDKHDKVLEGHIAALEMEIAVWR